MTQKERSKFITKLDRLFSQYIRQRDGRCLWCNSPSGLQCSHIISRKNFQFRWDTTNAITLCYACHIYKWHKSPLDAAEWLKTKQTFFYNKWLENRMSAHGKIDLLEIEKQLKNLPVNDGL